MASGMSARRYVGASIVASLPSLRALVLALVLGWCFSSVATAAICNQPMTNAIALGWVIGDVLQPAISIGLSATFVVDNKVNLGDRDHWGCLIPAKAIQRAIRILNPITFNIL